MRNVTRRVVPFSLRSVIAGAAGVVVALGAVPAFAQMVCGDHKHIKKRLETGYHEKPAGIGLAGNGGIIELYTSDKGTFTIILTRPNGLSCLMAVGENWQAITSAQSAALSPLGSKPYSLPR